MRFTREMLAPKILKGTIEGTEITISVLPQLGANLASFLVDGRELIYWDEAALLDEGEHTGCFHMFPTPCRLPEATYTFEGKRHKQTKHGEPVSIHGLLRDEPVVVTKGPDWLTAELRVEPGSPIYEGYPFPCTFTLRYGLIAGGIEIRFTYQNTGDGNAPFGYGLHPFWRLGASREDTAVRIPCAYRMELEQLLPTGVITPIEEGLDLRRTTSLEGVDIDNVFWGRDVTTPALVEFRDDGKQLVLEASEVFTHMIAYTPGGRPFGCVEFLTCAPNQINLGLQDEKGISGHIVAAPGETIEGWVRYVLRDL